MEALAVIGGVASTAHLIEIASKTGRILIELIDKTQQVPEELRRQKASVQSIQAKLQLLHNLFDTLPHEVSLPQILWQEFQNSLEEVQEDVQAVAASLQPYHTGKRRVSSVREKLRFQIRNQKALINSTKHLRASERNPQRIESTIHLSLTNVICRKTNLLPTESPGVLLAQHPRPATQCSRRSRVSLLKPSSFLRRAGFYSWFTDEQEQIIEVSRKAVCFGFCLPLWLILLSVSLEFALIDASSNQGGRTLQWSLRLHCRVQMESPLMKACQRGDVSLIQQILKEKNGGVNDRTICSGKTALMVAIEARHIAAVECLLQNGADPNLPDDDQNPAFRRCRMDPQKYPGLEQIPSTWQSWLHTFRLLVEYGASLYEVVRGRHIAGLNIVRDDQPPETLEYFSLLAAQEVLQLDVVSGRQCWSALQNALRSSRDTVDALKLLHSTGVDLNKIMDDGCTALHLAAE